MRNDAYTAAAEPRLATQPGPGLVPNHGGGYVSEIGDMPRARRFLILGTVGGTYYQGERDITVENLDVLRRLADSQPTDLAELIADVSERGLAPKVYPALAAFGLMTAHSPSSRAAAFAVFSRVVRTGSHLLAWARYHKAFGGKVNRSWRRTVSQWYIGHDADALAYQLAKYGQRDGWSQKDLIDMSHALSGTVSPAHAAALRWARNEERDPRRDEALPLLLRHLVNKRETPELIRAGASWEMLPDAALREAETWNLLLANRKLPLTAAMRNLARMTELGVLDRYFANPAAGFLTSMFGDERALRGARVHPIGLLMAHRAYGGGKTRSGLAYSPVPRVLDMLDDAFYKAFETAEASGKRTLVGVDISSSMTMNGYGTSSKANQSGLTPHEIATVLAMKILRTEPASHVVGFSHTIRELGMTPRMTLAEALRTTQGSFGSTDPSALISYATSQNLPVDTFVIITDNEVNRGRNVPEALRQYRERFGIDSKLIVLACTATNFTIADPNDPGMLDIAGFGADVAAVVTEFSRGI